MYTIYTPNTHLNTPIHPLIALKQPIKQVPRVCPEVIRQVLALISLILQKGCTAAVTNGSFNGSLNGSLNGPKGSSRPGGIGGGGRNNEGHAGPGQTRAGVYARLALAVLQLMAEDESVCTLLFTGALADTSSMLPLFERQRNALQVVMTPPRRPLCCAVMRILTQFLSVHVGSTGSAAGPFARGLPVYLKVCDKIGCLEVLIGCLEASPSISR
jgi:hypothetical protein